MSQQERGSFFSRLIRPKEQQRSVELRVIAEEMVIVLESGNHEAKVEAVAKLLLQFDSQISSVRNGVDLIRKDLDQVKPYTHSVPVSTVIHGSHHYPVRETPWGIAMAQYNTMRNMGLLK